jgi:hypothetical protein
MKQTRKCNISKLNGPAIVNENKSISWCELITLSRYVSMKIRSTDERAYLPRGDACSPLVVGGQRRIDFGVLTTVWCNLRAARRNLPRRTARTGSNLTNVNVLRLRDTALEVFPTQLLSLQGRDNGVTGANDNVTWRRAPARSLFHLRERGALFPLTPLSSSSSSSSRYLKWMRYLWQETVGANARARVRTHTHSYGDPPFRLFFREGAR